jgi:hypothetical protein
LNRKDAKVRRRKKIKTVIPAKAGIWKTGRVMSAVNALKNETDVREEFIAPLLRELGYKSGTENSIERERLLRYPFLSLGRDKKTDPPIVGKADYVCTAKNLTVFVVEAKPPLTPINDIKSIEQSWKYANHPEIRAVYFCLCNGAEFAVFQTNKGCEAAPVFSCDFYSDEKGNLLKLKNLLSPEALSRDHPNIELDCGLPLAAGLRSKAYLVNGKITFKENSHNLKPFEGMVMTITNGVIARDEDNSIRARVCTQVPYEKLQKLNEQLGLHEFTLFTTDKEISTSPENPTTLLGQNRIVFPKGMICLNIQTWEDTALPIDVTTETTTTAVGFLSGNTFIGEFTAHMRYVEIPMQIELSGNFSVEII